MATEFDTHEENVANTINNRLKSSSNFAGWTAIKSTKGPKFSDIQILNPKGDVVTYVEVKMNHSDNLVNYRFTYGLKKDGEFYFQGKPNPVKELLLKNLDGSIIGNRFIASLKKYLGRNEITIVSTSAGDGFEVTPNLVVKTKKNSPRLANANFETNPMEVGRYPKWKTVKRTDSVVSWYEFKDYFRGRNQYIGDFLPKNSTITDIVTMHYNKGKDEPAHYIQTGADFYLMGNEDPLGLNKIYKKSIPQWGAKGSGSFRIALGTAPGKTDMQVEVKAASVTTPSQYGFDKRNLKKNPFI